MVVRVDENPKSEEHIKVSGNSLDSSVVTETPYFYFSATKESVLNFVLYEKSVAKGKVIGRGSLSLESYERAQECYASIPMLEKEERVLKETEESSTSSRAILDLAKGSKGAPVGFLDYVESESHTLELSLCCMDFGNSPKRDVRAEEDMNGMLFASFLTDVKLLEIRDARTSSFVGNDVCVSVIQGIQSTKRFHSDFYKVSHGNVQFDNEDCTFRCDPENKFLYFELNGRRGDVIGSCRTVMDDGKTWVPLKRDGVRIAWLSFRVQTVFETDALGTSFLAAFGHYKDVLPFRVQFGDLVLQDIDSLAGRLISIATASKWDHISIVVPCGPHNAPHLMEATSAGVYAYPFEERVQAILKTGTRIGVRRLSDVQRDASFMKQMTGFVQENEGKQYEDNFVSLIKSRFKSNTEEDTSSFFCSELVAACLKAVGVFSQEIISSNYTPKDFTVNNRLLPGQIRGSFERLKVFHMDPFPKSSSSNSTSPRKKNAAGFRRKSSNSPVTSTLGSPNPTFSFGDIMINKDMEDGESKKVSFVAVRSSSAKSAKEVQIPREKLRGSTWSAIPKATTSNPSSRPGSPFLGAGRKSRNTVSNPVSPEKTSPREESISPEQKKSPRKGILTRRNSLNVLMQSDERDPVNFNVAKNEKIEEEKNEEKKNEKKDEEKKIDEKKNEEESYEGETDSE